MDKASRLIGILTLVAAVLVVVTLFTSVIAITKTSHQANRNQEFITCVSNWADETAKRTRVITRLNTLRTDALDAVVRDVASGINDRKKFAYDLNVYVSASDAYKIALKQHPIPKSPKLACANAKR